MGNTFTTKQWSLDTAMATAICTGGIYIRELEWHPNAADNDLLVEDGSSGVIWKIRAIAPASNDEASGIERKKFNGTHGELFYGFKLTTIDGGTLYVTYG